MSNLRPATSHDAAELAILDDIASSGLASWIWYGAVLSGRVDTAMEQGRQVMGDPKVFWGFSNAVMGDIDGLADAPDGYVFFQARPHFFGR